MSSRQTSDSAYLAALMGGAIAVLFTCSSLRHALFQSTPLDLALFDQLVYLVSQGLSPISSFLGFHLLGDHAAIILYPIALLCKLVPSVYWLFFVQAIALAAGVVPIYALSVQAGLSTKYARALAVCYLLYPALFNINFYTDYRPEAIAVPALLWACWAGTAKQTWQLAVAVSLVLSCKDTLSFTVIAFGVWLWISERRRVYGLACVGVGLLWLGATIGYLVPMLRQGQPGGVVFYASMGGSTQEIIGHLITAPGDILGRIVSPDRGFYYLLLVLPVVTGLHWRQALAAIPAVPMLVLNVLSEFEPQRDLIHHYSLPIFPFIFLWLVRSLQHYQNQGNRKWLAPRWLIVGSCIALLTLAQYSYFWTRYLSRVSYLDAVIEAVSRVPDQASVLASNPFCSHLSHRSHINSIDNPLTQAQLKTYDYVLLDRPTAPDVIQQYLQIQNSARFKLVYGRAGVTAFALKQKEDTNHVP